MARPAGQGEKTKKHIAETAKVLFEKKGYTATSMEEIREASQISKGSIYYHFKSKEELFLYAVEEASKVWRKNWEEQAEQVATAKEKLYLLAYHYATDMQDLLSRTVPEYIASGDMKQMIEEKIIQLFQPEYDVFYQIIEEGLYNKEFESNMTVKDLAFVLYSTLSGLSITQFFGYEKEKFYAIYERAIDVFLDGISKR